MIFNIQPPFFIIHYFGKEKFKKVGERDINLNEDNDR